MNENCIRLWRRPSGAVGNLKSLCRKHPHSANVSGVPVKTWLAPAKQCVALESCFQTCFEEGQVSVFGVAGLRSDAETGVILIHF